MGEGGGVVDGGGGPILVGDCRSLCEEVFDDAAAFLDSLVVSVVKV